MNPFSRLFTLHNNNTIALYVQRSLWINDSICRMPNRNNQDIRSAAQRSQSDLVVIITTPCTDNTARSPRIIVMNPAATKNLKVEFSWQNAWSNTDVVQCSHFEGSAIKDKRRTYSKKWESYNSHEGKKHKTCWQSLYIVTFIKNTFILDSNG
jgi:hypothetical protein